MEEEIKKQCSIECSCCTSNLAKGWSSHGTWAPLREIKQLEKERGNSWFNDKAFTGREKAVWICVNPLEALRYGFSAELSNALESGKLDPSYEPPEFLKEEFRELKEAVKHPENYLEEVDLKDASCVLEDGDGGFLYVKPPKSD